MKIPPRRGHTTPAYLQFWARPSAEQREEKRRPPPRTARARTFPGRLLLAHLGNERYGRSRSIEISFPQLPFPRRLRTRDFPHPRGSPAPGLLLLLPLPVSVPAVPAAPGAPAPHLHRLRSALRRLGGLCPGPRAGGSGHGRAPRLPRRLHRPPWLPWRGLPPPGGRFLNFPCQPEVSPASHGNGLRWLGDSAHSRTDARARSDAEFPAARGSRLRKPPVKTPSDCPGCHTLSPPLKAENLYEVQHKYFRHSEMILPSTSRSQEFLSAWVCAALSPGTSEGGKKAKNFKRRYFNCLPKEQRNFIHLGATGAHLSTDWITTARVALLNDQRNSWLSGFLHSLLPGGSSENKELADTPLDTLIIDA